MRATLDRPVAIRRRSHLARPRRAAGVVRERAARSLVKAGVGARRPVLYLASMAAGCYGAWQIWHPLGWIAGAACGVVVELLTGPEPTDEGQG